MLPDIPPNLKKVTDTSLGTWSGAATSLEFEVSGYSVHTVAVAATSDIGFKISRHMGLRLEYLGWSGDEQSCIPRAILCMPSKKPFSIEAFFVEPRLRSPAM